MYFHKTHINHKKDHFIKETFAVDGRIILEWNFKRPWPELIWTMT
jgi:hypothetical protein